MLLKEYMEKNNISQASMSRDIGVSAEYVRQLIKGDRTPSKKLAIEIERVTNGEVSKLELIFPEEF